MNYPTVYLLLSLKDQRTYLGSTINLERRIDEHNQGKSKSTSHRRPLKLIYFEEYKTLAAARNREKFLKTRQGRRELKNIFENIQNKKLNDNLNKLKRLKY